MKIKDGFILRQVAGNYIVIAVGEEAVDFNGMINVNETGAFLWKMLEDGADEAELVSALVREYDIDADTAGDDVAQFVAKLSDGGLLTDDE